MLGQTIIRYNSKNNALKSDKNAIVLESYQDIFRKEQSYLKKKGLRQAIKNFYAGWMPVNEEVYNEIKKNLLCGFYDNNREKFIKDIFKDFTILSIILKELPSLYKTENDAISVDFLKTIDIKKIKKIFIKDAKSHSRYLLSDMQDFQAVMYKLASYASSFSRIFATINDADTLSVYTISVLRILSNCLFSWNYPKLFNKALKSQFENKEDIEDYIKEKIGFSLDEVTQELLNIWNFNDDAKDKINKKVNAKSPLSSRIIKSVECGENIAKIQSSKYFPNIIGNVDAIASEIIDTKILNMIKNEIKRTRDYYKKYSPVVFSIVPSTKDKLKETILNLAQMKLEKNTYAIQCDDDMINSLKKAYLHITNGKFSKRALEILIYDAMPKAGFGEGCLYGFNEEEGKLTPILKFGNRLLSYYKVIRFDNNNVMQDKSIVDSLMCSTPIRQEFFSKNDELISCMCCSFGGMYKKGVLYLEVLDRNEEYEMITTKFKAILQCLNESLGYL